MRGSDLLGLEELELGELLGAHAVVAVGLTQVGAAAVDDGALVHGDAVDLDGEDVGAVNGHRLKPACDWRCYRLARLGRNSLLQGRDLGQADGLEAPSLVETEQYEPAVRHVPEGAQGLAERGHAVASGLHLNGRGVSATAAESVDERGQIDIDDILIDVVLVRSTVISTESTKCGDVTVDAGDDAGAPRPGGSGASASAQPRS